MNNDEILTLWICDHQYSHFKKYDWFMLTIFNLFNDYPYFYVFW